MVPQIPPAQLADWFASQAGQGAPLVLDVRQAWELQTASIVPNGFELLHIPMGELGGRLADVPSDRPLACLCHHGMRSQRVAQFLEQQGVGPLANIAGGIAAWSQQVDPSVPQY